MTKKDKAIDQARARLRESVEKFEKERNEKSYRCNIIDIEERRKRGDYKNDEHAFRSQESKDLEYNWKSEQWNELLDTLDGLGIDFRPCNLSHVYIVNKKGQTLMVYPKAKKISVKGQKPKKFYFYKNTMDMLKKYGVID